jgi:hypothetical protein
MHALLSEHAANFKLDRSQPDTIEIEPAPETLLERVLGELDLADARLAPLFTRTSAGFLEELKPIAALIRAEKPDFDFAAFEKVMLMSWETPALTDNERHLQYRYQYKLKLLLEDLQAKLRQREILAAGCSVYDLALSELIECIEKYRGVKL